MLLTKLLPVMKTSDWTTEIGAVARVGQTELALLLPEKMRLIALGMMAGRPRMFLNCKQNSGQLEKNFGFAQAHTGPECSIECGGSGQEYATSLSRLAAAAVFSHRLPP